MPTKPVAACFLLMALVCLGLAAGSCGYHVAGRGAALPKEWKTLAVVALENRTTTYRIEQRFTEALVREFLARTKYRIVSDPGSADAVLHGEITHIEANAILFDTATGRATTMLVTVRASVRLEDRESGRIIYQNQAFLFREPYEISTDVKTFFEEQQPALDRMARDFSSRLVAAILEKF